ncbi:hypothetical protein HUJ04_001855 [Dendroctonus ponderosae]|nr:hypothetical protein HUJ04_001855 [Dendroctonus ponderosae]
MVRFVLFQAQSDDDDVGTDDVAVTVEGRDGEFMNQFFQEASSSRIPIHSIKLTGTLHLHDQWRIFVR